MAPPVKAKRPRGRPRKVQPPVEAPRVATEAELRPDIDAVYRTLAGNGRDEAAYEPSPEELPAGTCAPLKPEAPPAPQLSKLFIAAVENGYIIRPAFNQGYKGEDSRSWVVTSREELARMVTWLVAERGEIGPDFLGGPVPMPQPGPHYAPPQVVEEAAGPMG